MKTSILKIAKFSDSITEDTNAFDIQVHFERLVEAWKKYEEVHLQIVEVTGEAEMPFQQIEYDDTENATLKALANFKKWLHRFEDQQRQAQEVRNQQQEQQPE